MKRAFLGGVVLFISLGLLSLFYYRYGSVVYVLKDEGFSKEDILQQEKYAVLKDETGTLFMLANSDRIGLIYSKSKKWGIREDGVTSSIAERPAAEQIITVAFARPTEELGRFEKHSIVAYYLANDEKVDIGSPDDFDLTVDYFAVNNRVLLVAHAVSTDRDSLGSDDIMAYLESYGR
ncbi:hypothetical protein NCCP2222_24870 [Sporosarcina sp. NCCP-2222]|uniref:hypothetical protein n=1 Tax=Sporosarcina sp. NCCP-2222 TaxID=2935073 RepID=UPI00207FBC07|nr:hypothetical protein [Sporosarcina sp. NCCP-2222]GKV56540.1 hypothetical protein NCCP2222_24870 [Sporosarcina sp. NCCP-2222]